MKTDGKKQIKEIVFSAVERSSEEMKMLYNFWNEEKYSIIIEHANFSSLLSLFVKFLSKILYILRYFTFNFGHIFFCVFN